MKKILMGLAMALMFFVLMIVLFVIVFAIFFPGDEEMLANGEIVSSKEMQAIIQVRDSLLVDVDSLLAVLAQNNVALDSLETIHVGQQGVVLLDDCPHFFTRYYFISVRQHLFIAGEKENKNNNK